MSSATPQPAPIALTTTGRRRRFERAHPYPELPRSRLPMLRALAWLVIASIAALGRLALSPLRRRAAARRATGAASEAHAAHALAAARQARRAPRTPSLTPRAPSLTPF